MFKKLIALVVLFFSVGLAQMDSSKTSPPEISVKPGEYDFGSVTQGDKVTHDFEIYNNGKSNLSIINVRASCGCTAATPAKTKLEPGDSTKLVVVFDSTNKLGRQNKIVYIKTNDPSNPVFNVKFTGEVMEPSKQTEMENK
jgi:uncharacterized cupredoxin-like copper-binding protein